MKKLFFVLLLANAGFFALMRLGGAIWVEQAKPEQPPLHEEQIRLLDMSKSEPAKLPRLPVPVPAHAPIPASPPPAAALPPAKPVPVQPAPKPVAQSCLEWGDFSGPDLARAQTALSKMQLGNRLSQREIEHDTGYWVYIPPLKNKSAANKKVGELRRLGIKEYFVVTNAGYWRNAISLGVFKTREAAQNFLNLLHSKGVRSAQIGERASKLRATRYMLSGVNSETSARLIAMQKGFVGSALVNVPCALTR